MVKLNKKRLKEEKQALDMQWDKALVDMQNGMIDQEKVAYLMERLNAFEKFLMDQKRR